MLRTTVHIQCEATNWLTLGPYRRLRKLLSEWHEPPEHGRGTTKDGVLNWLRFDLSDNHHTARHLAEVASHLDEYLTFIAKERSRAYPTVLQVWLFTTGTNGHEKQNFTRRFRLDPALLLKLAAAGIGWDLEVCPCGGNE